MTVDATLVKVKGEHHSRGMLRGGTMLRDMYHTNGVLENEGQPGGCLVGAVAMRLASAGAGAYVHGLAVTGGDAA